MDYSLAQVAEHDTRRIMAVYGLLREAMGAEAVEDWDSFRRTVSALTDAFVLPRVVCAMDGDEVIGAVVGAYLKKLGMGFIAYSAVREDWRRRGVYPAMRRFLLLRLAVLGKRSGVISELELDSWLYRKYIDHWNAVELPCDYEQPQAQGLQVRPLKLVVQPRLEGVSLDTMKIVREVYRGVYRIPKPEENDSYQRIAASVAEGAAVPEFSGS